MIIVIVISQWQIRGANIATVHAEPTSLKVLKKCMYNKDWLANVNSWFKANKLSLNVTKTEFLIIGFCQRLQTQTEVSIQAHVEGKEIKS